MFRVFPQDHFIMAADFGQEGWGWVGGVGADLTS